jgi:chromosomal replication initiation ATPase DnaA
MTIDTIIQVVCKKLSADIHEIITERRFRRIVKARQIIAYFALIYDYGQMEIANKLGYKEHSTVIHCRKAVNDLYFSDKKFREEIDMIRIELKNIEIKNTYSNEYLLSIYDAEIMNEFAMNDIF